MVSADSCFGSASGVSFREHLLRSWRQPNPLTILLWPLSLVYRSLFALRNRLYKIGFFASYSAPVPVIVVGNITVGGTGKSPLVIHLVGLLRDAGYTPGVISRGYKSQASEFPYQVTSNSGVKEAGDEPLMIVRRTGVPMAIGPNRRKSIELLISQYDIDIVISDDGLQHLALDRDIEICLVDNTSAQTNQQLLPAGPYREPISRLTSVDFLIHHGGDNGSITMQLIPSQPRPLLNDSGSGDTIELDSDRNLHAVAGIGNPQRFFNTCGDLGLNFKPHAFPDHHAFTASDLEFDDGLVVLMTEKDAVKCQQFAKPNHWYLPVNAKLSAGFSDQFIDAISAIETKI